MISYLCHVMKVEIMFLFALQIWQNFLTLRISIPLTIKRISMFYTLIERGRIAVTAEACPPPDMGRGRGPTETSGRKTTQETLGGVGVSEANGVLCNHCYPPGAI